MRQDWIEFKVDNGNLFVKYYDVESVRNAISKVAGPCASISLSNGTSHTILEPYEQVKQKIMDAEKVDLSDVTVEHFTRDEYKKIAAVMKAELKGCIEDGADIERTTKIVDKLNEILKENK